jgi:hypothetical protein
MLPRRKARAAKASRIKASKNNGLSETSVPTTTTCIKYEDASNETVENVATTDKKSLFRGCTDDEGYDGSDEQEEQAYDRPVAVLSLGKCAASLIDIPSRSFGLFNLNNSKRRKLAPWQKEATRVEYVSLQWTRVAIH